MTRSSSRSRDSGFSIFRIGMIFGVLGILIVIGGAIMFSLEQAGQRAPLQVDPPAGAELRLQEDPSSSARRLYYVVENATAEDIAVYYNQKMSEFYGDDFGAERCRRLPLTGNYEGFVEGNGTVPYNFRCLFDSSSFQADRFTQIDIQPGVLNSSTGMDNRGSVVIEYVQQWQP